MAYFFSESVLQRDPVYTSVVAFLRRPCGQMNDKRIEIITDFQNLDPKTIRIKRSIIQIRRVSEGHSKSDGYRILADRLWPRGLTKVAAHVDLWMKAIGPSNELRKWYHQDMSQWQMFRKKYLTEIKGSTSLVEFAAECAKHNTVTAFWLKRRGTYSCSNPGGPFGKLMIP